MYINVNEGQLYVEVHGDLEQARRSDNSAKDAVLFLHGFTLDSQVWRAQVEDCRFQERFSLVVTMDLFGFGRSSLPERDGEVVSYSHSQHLLDVLQTLNIERVHLVGMSMGGGVAIEFALRYPDRVASLMLTGSICPGQPWSDEWIGSMKEIAHQAKTSGIELAKQRWRQQRVFSGIEYGSAADRLISEVLNRYSGWHWFNRDPAMTIVPSVFSRLNEIRCPVLAINGENDSDDFKVTSERLESELGKQQFQIVNLCHLGHLPSIEAPQLFNNALLNFLDT